MFVLYILALVLLVIGGFSPYLFSLASSKRNRAREITMDVVLGVGRSFWPWKRLGNSILISLLGVIWILVRLLHR